GNLTLFTTHQKVLRVLEQAAYLGPKYHVVIANPPYMGSKGINPKLKVFLQDNYTDVKSDLFSAFIERIMGMVQKGGFIGMMTPFNWMFLSSFEKIRGKILGEYTLTNLVHPEYHAFFDSAYVPICGFTLYTRPVTDFKGSFIDLQKFYGANLQPVKALEAINNSDCGWFYCTSAADFKKIPGSPIAYWVSKRIRDIFTEAKPLSNIMWPRKGIATGNNDRFLRLWYEVSSKNTVYPDAISDIVGKWYAITKGGQFRKWYGNHDYLVNWENEGNEIKNYRNPDGSLKSRPQNTDCFFKGGITWSDISSSQNAFRILPRGFAIEGRGPGGFLYEHKFLHSIISFLNSKITSYSIRFINPTLSVNIGDISKLPVIEKTLESNYFENLSKNCIDISHQDWDSYETSWDFTIHPLLRTEYHQPSLKKTYIKLCAHWHEMTLEMQRLEEENNRIFIEAYGL
ncbi:MAG: Eco57I restriction-modification methylase domain-containing protein, partial [Candidatus Heimdallarchaeota archaeon]|nr:Eco57I restriction-modification methylase domain-containing protein [Candidatus Heimdallarchaeota archaeon]